ncbi:MAG: GxxExxY protein [Bacteroidota bacterium]
MPVNYKNQQIGTRRVDFFVEGAVSVEGKSPNQINHNYFNYL